MNEYVFKKFYDAIIIAEKQYIFHNIRSVLEIVVVNIDSTNKAEVIIFNSEISKNNILIQKTDTTNNILYRLTDKGIDELSIFLL